MPGFSYIALAMILGFVAYGLSIFIYVRAQNALGAAKTSACYAVAPFIGAFLSFVFLRERLTGMYLIAFGFMIAGTVLVVADTLMQTHIHLHQHTFTHVHDGCVHTHIVVHSHEHNHYRHEKVHIHHHSKAELEKALAAHI
ncbi:MAG: DMT family transporter [Clostridiales bacterium]|nr:DMT family transporter [Clostridiales bacterium]